MSLKGAASEVLNLLETGTYVAPSGGTVDISESQSQAVSGTRLYRPSDFPDFVPWRSQPSRAAVEVVDGTSTELAHAMSQHHDLALLNFASARNPGGGFLNGAKAQEEDLCRCSGLYPALLTQPDYYKANRAQKSLIYTDHLIYTPRVPFFRVKGRAPFLEVPYFCSVLTAPAPNGAELKRRPEALLEVEQAFMKRWAMVLEVARLQAHRSLILGAWGCGAFGNAAETSARTAYQCLHSHRFAESFDRVVFAIPNRGKRSAINFTVFSEVFTGCPGSSGPYPSEKTQNIIGGHQRNACGAKRSGSPDS